ncbi:hypothetical protein NJT12_16090 [Flavobacterium sp. AC]|uniref:Uncharacterized protein n=1 Tax=Flavobacterium azizsancarii TaxID=2961580 RepID=A0ABT4WF01_9FLAO|nr:hypothetical protein [Flavobacterium azizsancarii]MDA6071137.1 hypothetical protein [Flavobacterium azizsancarii]
MKKLQKKSLSFILFGILLNTPAIYCQTSNEITAYNWFDKNLGVESLEFENGPAHLNFDRAISGHNRYYISQDFIKGSIRYNDQEYFDLLLNLDTYSDELVLKPYGDQNTTKINLIKNNISSFKIGTEKFVNLKEFNSAIFRKGYYQEVPAGNNIVLYIKYYKDRKKNSNQEIDLIEFIPKHEFIILKEGKFYPANDKKEIIALFPDSKRKINDFYLTYRNLKKENIPLFTKNLLKYINN